MVGPSLWVIVLQVLPEEGDVRLQVILSDMVAWSRPVDSFLPPAPPHVSLSISLGSGDTVWLQWFETVGTVGKVQLGVDRVDHHQPL